MSHSLHRLESVTSIYEIVKLSFVSLTRNETFLGLLTSVFSYTPTQSRYTNVTSLVPMSRNEFVRLKKCVEWLLDVVYFLCFRLLSTDRFLQNPKKNERKTRSHFQKEPGYEILVAYTTCGITEFAPCTGLV